MIADFTSGHFLGLDAGPAPTGSLTTGHPAVLGEPVGHRLLAQQVARVAGAPAAVLARTSLHALLDAVDAVAGPQALVLVDEHLYPVGRWAVAAAHPEGPVAVYRHHSPDDALARAARTARRVVVVTDGLCGSCLTPAPLRSLEEVAGATGGTLVVDDSLATGVLGTRTRHHPVLGADGAGTAAWLGLPPGGRVTVASFAKGYGAPLAAVAGPVAAVAGIREAGPARTHASPPTACDVAALAAALSRADLGRRRTRLAAAVGRVRALAGGLGLRPLGIAFPVLNLDVAPHDPRDLQAVLATHGVRVLVTRGRCVGRAVLTLCVRADTTDHDLEALAAGLRAATARGAA